MSWLVGLASHGGVARRSRIAVCAADRRAVAAALASGELHDLGGGWVAAADAPADVVAARRLNGSITCVSAIAHYGLQELTASDTVHVAVPRSRGAHPVGARLGARLHRETHWAKPVSTGLPLAPITEVLARVLRCRPEGEAVVMVDSALNKRLVTAEEIAPLLAGPGARSALATLDRCHPGSRSVIESVARLALEGAGMRVAAGVRIEGVGEVDLLVDGWLVVECDGFAYHSGRTEYRNDRRRDRALAARGFVVLRFTWEELMAGPELVVRDVRRVLRLGRGSAA